MSKKKLYTVNASAIQQPLGKSATLPGLSNRHGDVLESVAFGPRREMALKIKPLMWDGGKGYYGPATTVRFGGIVNYEQVQESFKSRYCRESELNGIEYNPKQFSNPGDLHLLLSFERIDVIVDIHCRSLSVPEPDVE